MTESMTLRELTAAVSAVVNEAFDAPLWVTAELSDVRPASNGHCYMQLLEKDPHSGRLLAQARGIIWGNRWWLLRDTFAQQTGQTFASGLKVLLLVHVQMHETYGLSLVIQDVDPTYTLGDMARRRQEILRQLEADGIIDMNRQLPMPQLPQRVAVISAASAAGYGDFCQQLHQNDWGFCFYTRLFPAVMQGQQTEASVIAALEQVYALAEYFDLVVIIRGGGSTTDLASFDSFPLAECVANFPLPVITGIGHDRDQTVLDRVAHTSVKTPTAVADLLIDQILKQWQQLTNLQQALLEGTRGRLEREQLRVQRLASAVRGTHVTLGQQINRLTLLGERIKLAALHRLDRDRQQLGFVERTVQMAQPDNLLRRGFSIVRDAQGHAVTSPSALQPLQTLQVQSASGSYQVAVSANNEL